MSIKNNYICKLCKKKMKSPGFCSCGGVLVVLEDKKNKEVLNGKKAD